MILAPITFFWVPNRVDEAWFLNDEQKEHARIRYEMNKQFYDPDERFSWFQVGRGFKDWKVSTLLMAVLGLEGRRT